MKSRGKVCLFTPLCLFGLLLAVCAPSRAQVYAIQDLGVLPGETDSIANDLNDAGQVVGNSGLFGFLWSNGTMTKLVLPGDSNSVANGINAGGNVVGSSHHLNGQTHAYMFNSLGDMSDLHYLLLGGVQNNSDADDINSWGQIVGGAFTPGDQFHAFLRDPFSNHTYDLGTLGGPHSEALAINYRTEAAGYANTPNGVSHAFYWDQYRGMVDIGTFAGYYGSSAAYDINDSSEVVGSSDTAGSGTRAFVWSPSSGYRQDLGTLGGNLSVAMGNNNNHQIVGYSTTAAGQQHAFLWLPGITVIGNSGNGGVFAAVPIVGLSPRIIDLNSLLNPNSGWVLYAARAINNKGQIAGYGTHFGQTRAFLMTPVSVQSLTISPNVVAGGRLAVATVTLNASTPVDLTVTLTNDNPAVTAPASVVVPAGSSSASVLLTTQPVATSTSGTITATFGATASASITVRPPFITSLTLIPSSVKGGQSTTGVVTLDGVSAGTTVLLTSNKPTVAAPAVGKIAIPAGSKTVKFTVNTRPVLLATQTVAISASANGSSKTALLAVTP